MYLSQTTAGRNGAGLTPALGKPSPLMSLVRALSPAYAATADQPPSAQTSIQELGKPAVIAIGIATAVIGMGTGVMAVLFHYGVAQESKSKLVKTTGYIMAGIGALSALVGVGALIFGIGAAVGAISAAKQSPRTGLEV